MKAFEEQSHYEILDLPVSATTAEIRAAYDHAWTLYGPESLALYALVEPRQAEAFRARLREAVEVLTEPDQRSAYDRTLGRPPPAVVEAPQAVVEAPQAVVEAPQAVIEAPQAVIEAPQAVVEAPQAVVEAPPAVVEAPQAVVEAPPAVVEAPQAVIEAPQAVVEAPQATVETPPQAVVEAPQAVVEAPPAVVEAPQAVIEAPQAVIEAPPAVVEAPQATVETPPQAVVEAPQATVETPPQAVAPTPEPLPVIEVLPPEGRFAETRHNPMLASSPLSHPEEAHPAPPRVREIRPRLPEFGPNTEFNGELLRQIREARGLSLQVVADRTRISRGHLENVEADRYAHLPPTVYLRGILVNLARELRVDPQWVCRSYLALVTQRQKG